MTDLEAFFLLLATILGAITTSGLGWADSSTKFEPRKFIPSLIRGIIAAAIAFTAQYVGYLGEITLFTYLGAYFAGGGFDVIGNRISGIVQSSPAPTPPASASPATPTPTAPTNFHRLKRRLMFLQIRK